MVLLKQKLQYKSDRFFEMTDRFPPLKNVYFPTEIFQQKKSQKFRPIRSQLVIFFFKFFFLQQTLQPYLSKTLAQNTAKFIFTVSDRFDHQIKII